jgi:hypothetical protein
MRCGLDQECGYEDIVYPANASTAAPGIFCTSASAGARAGQAQLSTYAARCPQAKLILIGYSQGGSVIGDMLGGGGGPIFDCVQPDNSALDPTTSPGSRSKFLHGKGTDPPPLCWLMHLRYPSGIPVGLGADLHTYIQSSPRQSLVLFATRQTRPTMLRAEQRSTGHERVTALNSMPSTATPASSATGATGAIQSARLGASRPM